MDIVNQVLLEINNDFKNPKVWQIAIETLRNLFEKSDQVRARKFGYLLKSRIEKEVKTKFDVTLWELEKAFFGENIFEINLLYSILLVESQYYVFDSYMRYIEHKRDIKDRFYMPKRKQFVKIGVIQALQDLIDDKLDILSISLPPGTGKAQPLYSKVLTPSGFVRMGDIEVGDKVIAGNGNVATVLGVFPQGKMPIYEITLRDGMKCRCCNEHLWTCLQDGIGETTVTLEHIINNGWRTFLIPIYGSEPKYNPISNIEYIGEEECQCIYISDPCHLYITDDYIITHNTTLEKFFHSAIAGWYVDGYNLFFSHSGDITRMYYDGVYDIVTNRSEYAWGEIFPGLKVSSTNAKLEQFNVGKYKPFPSVQCTSVGAKNAGKVRANKFLLCDDLIGGIEEAMNKNALDKLWNVYATDARQRKVDGCKEIHIATRWSVHDVIGRLQRAYEGSKRCRFIAVPDVDPETGKSNFDFEINGFSEQFYRDQEAIMDDVTYKCLYKNQPIEREGLLYHDDELRRFTELPNREPDAILGVCDTKSKGVDYYVLPCLYQYDDDYYLVDAICNNESDYELQYEKTVNLICEHNMQAVEFESNAGGDRIAHEVSRRLKEAGQRCNITTKATETNKETRIIVNAAWIKQHILFKQKEDYSPKSDYGVFMNQMLTYTVAGKNPHDDVVDCLANFALFRTRGKLSATVEAIANPFRRNPYSFY